MEQPGVLVVTLLQELALPQKRQRKTCKGLRKAHRVGPERPKGRWFKSTPRYLSFLGNNQFFKIIININKMGIKGINLYTPDDVQSFLETLEYDHEKQERMMLFLHSVYPGVIPGHGICVYRDPGNKTLGSVAFSKFEHLRCRPPEYEHERELEESYICKEIPSHTRRRYIDPSEWKDGWEANLLGTPFADDDLQSPEQVIKECKAICIEGALTAVALLPKRYKPRILCFEVFEED
jgi:hypothetical protein